MNANDRNRQTEPLNEEKKRCDIKKWFYQRNTQSIYFCYVVAYLMQTTLVDNYIQANLLQKYNVAECKSEEDSGENEGTSENPGTTMSALEEQNMTLCEADLKFQSIYLVKVYAISAFVLAPFVASFSDGVNRIILMYISYICMLASAVVTAIAIMKSATIDNIIWCSDPPNFTGGTIVLTVVIFSYESDRVEGFKLFERFLELTATYVSAKAMCQLLLSLINPPDLTIPLKDNGIIWVPLGFLVAGLIFMVGNYSRIKDEREKPNLSLGQSLLKIIPLDYYHFFKCPLMVFISLLCVCTFFYYGDYVGETLEVITMINEKEPWQISSVSLQGAVQNITQSIGLFIMIYIFKKMVDKRVVDKHLLPKISLSYLGILAFAMDFLTKAIVSVIPAKDSNIQIWVPLLGVVCELAMVVIRFFAVLLVPKDDSAKSLTLLAWAQLFAIVPGPYMVQAVSAWSENFWANFVYIFMALLLIIPSILLWIVGRFGQLPDIVHQLNPVEEEEKKKGRLRKLFTGKKYNTDMATVIL